MCTNINNKAASVFQFLNAVKSKAKQHGKLEHHGHFHSHLKQLKAKAHWKHGDNVDISHHHGKHKPHTYEPPQNAGNPVNQQPPAPEEVVENQPPVAEEIVEPQPPVAEETIEPGLAEKITQALALVDKALAEESFGTAHLGVALQSIAKSFRLERGETTGFAANYEDAFADLGKAYGQVYDFIKMRGEELGYDEKAFDAQLFLLNKAFDNAITMSAVRSADLAYRQFECGSLVQPVEVLDFEYIEFDGLWDLDPHNMFAEAARNHSEVFINNFLETFRQEGHDSAMAAAQKALMNMPATTSTSDISFNDLNIIINAANKGGFEDLDDLRNSDLSDFMKKDLKDDWLFKQQMMRDWNEKGQELLGKQKILSSRLIELNMSPDLPEEEKEAQRNGLEALIRANMDEMAELMAQLPGAGHYRMYYYPINKETFAEAVEETQGAEGHRGQHGGQKGGRLSEVSLRDPWPAGHPLREKCDRFLEIFKTTYHEVLAEMGLMPQSGDFSSVVMSNKDFKELARRMVEKLNANQEARELMAVLNVDFSEGHPKKVKAGAEAFAEGARLIFEMWRKRHQDAARAGENDSGVKGFDKPKKQPTRNIEMLDFWRDTTFKRREDEEAAKLADWAAARAALLAADRASKSAHWDAIEDRSKESGGSQALKDYTKLMDKILGRNLSAQTPRNKEEKIKELTEEIKKLNSKLSEIAFNPEMPDPVKSIQIKTIRVQIQSLEAQISQLAGEGEEDGSAGGPG